VSGGAASLRRAPRRDGAGNCYDKGLLFDMDGVLISSIGFGGALLAAVAKLYDIPNAETYEIPHGMRAGDHLLATAGH